MSPLPEDIGLPSGWVCKRVRADELVLGYEKGGLEVVAARIDDADRLPFEVACGWDLTCRIRAGESVSERAIGRVSTRPAAVEALRSWMERVGALVRTTGSAEGLSLTRIVRDSQLDGGIPSMASNHAVGD